MSESSSNKPSSLVVGATTTVAVVATLCVVRAIRRWMSPVIRANLSCSCGKIQGVITAIRQDSIRINCYCSECREYANYIASLGGEKDKTIGRCGDTRVVQVCKSAIHLTQGQEYLKLARKAPQSQDNKQIYMHRFYASCCNVPLFNTVDFLGFSGIFTDFLDKDAVNQFAGPVCMFPEQALQQPREQIEQDIFVPDFLWKLVRYHPWRKSGPFDYDQTPVYWGKECNANHDDDDSKAKALLSE